MPEATVPDEQMITAAIAETFCQITEREDSPNGLHNMLLYSVARLSSRFGLDAEVEYVLPRFRGDRPGRLDVVWKLGSIPVVAFEIDSACRVKSLRKLLTINANLRFWIYYGAGDIDTFVKSIDPISIIRVVRVGVDCRTQEQRPKSPLNEVKRHDQRSHAGPFEEIRKVYARAYERWTQEEDNSLADLSRVRFSHIRAVTFDHGQLSFVRARLR